MRRDFVNRDYWAITELPATLLSQEQWLRICHRYHLAAELSPGRRVLEVACGAGAGLGLLACQAQYLAAVDYSLSVLQAARSHYGRRTPLAASDAQHLPFPDHSFDLIVCFEAIYYLTDYTCFLRESRRLLAPGGVLLLSFSNPDWPFFAPGLLTSYYPSGPEVGAELVAAGFGNIEAFGLLPTSAATPGARLRDALRRLVLQRLPSAGTGQAAQVLKRLLYRRQQPLPAELAPEGTGEVGAALPMTALDWMRSDQIHRVIYLRASVPGPAGKESGASNVLSL